MAQTYCREHVDSNGSTSIDGAYAWTETRNGSPKALPPLLFSPSIHPSHHLRQFSARIANAGAGFIAGPLTITGGVLMAVTVANGGANYEAPRVLITGDGEGAVATAIVVGGTVTGINVTSGGTGYTTASVYVVSGAVVVLVGDSISTERPTPSIPNENLWTQLRRAIQEQNPSGNITFFNRAIGSTSWTSFNAVPNGKQPDWYSNHSKPWIDYVKELQPDLLVCAFGMNDRQTFFPQAMKVALMKTTGFDTRPDLVLCTCMVPSKSTGLDQLSSEESQIGRDFASGYIRGYAIVNDLGLIDLNRQYRLVRDGMDVRQSALKTVTVNGSQTLPWTAPTSCADFYLSAEFKSLCAGWWVDRKIDILLTPEGVNANVYARVEDDSGKIKISIVEIYIGLGSETLQTGLTSGIDTPTNGNVVVAISCLDQRAEILVNGVQVFAQIIYRCGGTFKPRLISSGSTATIEFYAGEFTQYQPLLNDDELWGGESIDGYGGNRKNHPSSIGVAYVIAPVVHNSDWTSIPVNSEKLVQGSGTVRKWPTWSKKLRRAVRKVGAALSRRKLQ